MATRILTGTQLSVVINRLTSNKSIIIYPKVDCLFTYITKRIVCFSETHTLLSPITKEKYVQPLLVKGDITSYDIKRYISLLEDIHEDALIDFEYRIDND